MRALVCGWFTFPGMGATAGDLMARDVVCGWLDEAGYPYDVALCEAFGGGDWRGIEPKNYSAVIFVCGPFGNGGVVPEFLERFAHCRMVGIDLTMLHQLQEWNPFDVVWERDSDRTSRPDLVFLAPSVSVPVVGVVLVRRQKEYLNGVHAEADEMVNRLLASQAAAAVQVDTCLDPNRTGLRAAAEIESVITRMDVVVTTRLHGLVLALRNGIPVVALDPVSGGAKVVRQAETIDWPYAFRADQISDEDLSAAFDTCLSEEARRRARDCATRARSELRRVHDEFLAEFDAAAEKRLEGTYR